MEGMHLQVSNFVSFSSNSQQDALLAFGSLTLVLILLLISPSKSIKTFSLKAPSC